MSLFKKIVFLTLVIVSIFTFSTLHAQTPQDIINGIQNNIQLSTNPSFPEAGQQVTASVESYSTDLNSATITWIVSGKVLAKGVGEKSVSFIVGGIGSKTTVVAQIVTSDGASVRRELTIQPADIDLLWQAESYTPPLYRGKAMYPHQGLITFIAVPNISAAGSSVSSLSNYVFTWNKDGEVLGDYSGYGKNTFTLRGTVISKAFTIQVTVATKNGTVLGTKSVRIKPRSPEIVFYPRSPLYGTYYNAAIVDSGTLLEKEVTITAVPYYFDKTALSNSLNFKWILNGSKVDVDQKNITLRQTADGGGIVGLKLTIENVAQILQFATNQLTLTYGNTNTTGF